MSKHTMKKMKPASRKSRGYGLMEALIVAVCIAVGIAAIYTFYQKVYATQEAHEESQNVAELTNRIMKAYGPMANFTGLSTTSIINEGVVPSSIGVSGGAIISSFGGNVVVTAQEIDGIAGAGFGITYRDVPKNQCSKLVSSVNQLQRYRAITVAPLGMGTDNQATIVAENGRLDERVMSTACGSASRLNVTFLYQKTDNAAAAAGLDLCVAPSPENRTSACPSGYLGSISETRVATCESPYGLPIWGSWTETSNTCAIVCTPAPTSPETEPRPCPNPSHIGGVTVQRTSTCSGPTGLPVWSAWTEIANTCGAPCIVPSPQLDSQLCPAGQIGIIKRRRVATCPDPIGTPAWGGWTVYENTCAAACVLPTPATQSQWRQASEACPQGYSGNVFWDYEQERTATCPQATGSYVWSDWRTSGRTRNRDESQCTSLCSPDSPLERWVPGSRSCPAGHTGTITFEARETRTSTCAPGATDPNTSAWQRTGDVRNEVNSCVPSACVVSANTSKTWSLGSNSCSATVATQTTITSGSSLTVIDSAAPVTGKAVYQCTNGTLSTTPNVGATCAVTSCQVPANRGYSWSVGGATCNASTAATSSYIAVGSSVTLRDTVAPTTGQGLLACATGGTLATTVTGGTCVGACGPAPNADTREQASCPAGQYGVFTQSNPYESVAYPGCWGQTTNTWTPATPPAGTCKTCPANTTDTQQVWQARSQACPTGQEGTNTWEELRNQSRTVTYSCPAGTPTLPSAVRGNWTNGTWTGTKRNVVNTCTIKCVAPANVIESRLVRQTQSLSCPAFQTGSIGQYRDNTERRTISYTCPSRVGAPQETIGPWTHYSYGGWVTSSNTCAIPACGSTLESYARNYMSRYLDLYNAFGTNYQAAYLHWINGGYYEGRTSCWAAPCALPNPSSQTNTDTTGFRTRTVNACPAGQYGNISQRMPQRRTQTRTAYCPAQTGNYAWGAWSGWSAWVDNGSWSNTSVNCTNCPPRTAATQDQWANRSAACSNPYLTGSITWQEIQRRTYYRNWSCPAGTATLPAETHDGHTAWAWTGTTRNRAECGLPACGSTLQSQAMRYMAANQDLYNAFAGNWQAAKNHWDTYGHKEGRPGSCWAAPPACTPGWEIRENTTCPSGQYLVPGGAGTDTRYRSCPGPTYSDWTRQYAPQCCRTGRTCYLQ